MMFSEVILKIQKLKKYAYCSGEKMGKNNYCNDDNTKVHDTKVKKNSLKGNEVWETFA